MRTSDSAVVGSGLARRAVLAQYRAKFEAIAVRGDGGGPRRTTAGAGGRDEINRGRGMRTSITL